MSTWIVVDVEADGPVPGIDMYSMVSFGAVVLDSKLDKTFYGQTAPISKLWIPEALKVSGHTREEHERFPDPRITMLAFQDWLLKQKNINGQLVFVSDNNGFDWQFINYYLHKFTDSNSFGFSSRRIGDIFAGAVGNVKKTNEWKRLKDTKHTHHPVDDAMGNAEALIKIEKAYKLNIPI